MMVGGSRSDTHGAPHGLRDLHLLVDNGLIHAEILELFGEVFAGQYGVPLPIINASANFCFPGTGAGRELPVRRSTKCLWGEAETVVGVSESNPRLSRFLRAAACPLVARPVLARAMS